MFGGLIMYSVNFIDTSTVWMSKGDTLLYKEAESVRLELRSIFSSFSIMITFLFSPYCTS